MVAGTSTGKTLPSCVTRTLGNAATTGRVDSGRVQMIFIKIGGSKLGAAHYPLFKFRTIPPPNGVLFSGAKNEGLDLVGSFSWVSKLGPGDQPVLTISYELL
jgi:hypothetical protein